MMDGLDKRKGAKKHPSFLYILTIDKKHTVCYYKNTKRKGNK